MNMGTSFVQVIHMIAESRHVGAVKGFLCVYELVEFRKMFFFKCKTSLIIVNLFL